MDECTKIGRGWYSHVRPSMNQYGCKDVPKVYTRPFVSLKVWCKLRVLVKNYFLTHFQIR
ncbi:hypothetical protein YC2023_076194 [Brassica napus]